MFLLEYLQWFPTVLKRNKKSYASVSLFWNTVDQMDLLDVYRTFHPTSTQCTFFSAAHGTFSKIDHILGHKTSLSKYKKIEIMP
jgi:exonuclease III